MEDLLLLSAISWSEDVTLRPCVVMKVKLDLFVMYFWKSFWGHLVQCWEIVWGILSVLLWLCVVYLTTFLFVKIIYIENAYNIGSWFPIFLYHFLWMEVARELISFNNYEFYFLAICRVQVLEWVFIFQSESKLFSPTGTPDKTSAKLSKRESLKVYSLSL